MKISYKFYLTPKYVTILPLNTNAQNYQQTVADKG